MAFLPSGVFGPVECWEFCRLDFWFFSEITMLVILRKSDSGCWGRNAHTRFNDRTRVVRKSRVRRAGIYKVVCVQLDAAGNFISETCDRAEVFSVPSPHAAQAASGHNQNRRLSDGRGAA